MCNRKNNGNGKRASNGGSKGNTMSLLAAMLLGLAAMVGGCDEANLAASVGGFDDSGWYDGGGYWDDSSYSDDYYGGYDAGDAIETYLGNYVIY